MIKFTGFDLFTIALLLLGMFWYWTLLAAAVLAGLGWLARRWLRWALFGLASLLALYVAGFWLLAGLRASGERLQARSEAAHAATLLQMQRESRSMDGFLLPVGARVQWTDESKSAFTSVDLPGPTPELGTVLTGHIELGDHEFGATWTATLPAAEPVDGWQCAAGAVKLGERGNVADCTLAAARRFRLFTVPAGATLHTLYPNGDDVELDVETPDGVSIDVPAYGIVVPAGYKLQISRSGAVRKIESDIDRLGGDDSTWPKLTIHGLRAHFFIELYQNEMGEPSPAADMPPRWARVNLFGTATCAGQTLPDDNIRLYFADLTVQDGSGGARTGPRFPLATCTVPAP